MRNMYITTCMYVLHAFEEIVRYHFTYWGDQQFFIFRRRRRMPSIYKNLTENSRNICIISTGIDINGILLFSRRKITNICTNEFLWRKPGITRCLYRIVYLSQTYKQRKFTCLDILYEPESNVWEIFYRSHACRRRCWNTIIIVWVTKK